MFALIIVPVVETEEVVRSNRSMNLIWEQCCKTGCASRKTSRALITKTSVPEMKTL
jgi:hypothetical protein